MTLIRDRKTTIAFRLLGATIALVALASINYRAQVCAQTQDSSTKVSSIPFEGIENYILIKARVNDSEPLLFELDSGGGSGLILYFKAAEALRLKAQGKGKGGGGGAATFETSTVKGATLSLGGVELNNQTFVVFPPDRPPTLHGRFVDGVIGYSLFSRYVVEIDFQSQVVNLYEPKSFRYSGPGESIPIKVMSNVPFARMNVMVEGRKPITGDFLVDTGAGRFTVILNTPLVESTHLLTGSQKIRKEPGSRGVGGSVELMVGRLPGVQVGQYIFTNPFVHFAQDRKGALASSDFSGLLGGELLSRFKVIFDYTHKRMILEPNRNYDAPFEYDETGVRLETGSDDVHTFRVRGVIENSPAFEAGMQEGEIITAIDGKPAAELSYSQIIQMFKQEDKEYLIEITHGAEKKQLKLKTRKLI